MRSIKLWCGKHKVLVGIIIFIILYSIAYSIVFFIEEYRKESGKESIEQAIQNDNKEDIMEGIKSLPKMDDVESLVKQLVETDNLDAAVYLVDNKSNNKRSDALYKALIEVERMDDAWDYHYQGSSIDKPDQAEEYKSYMIDVVKYYCEHDKKNEARKFVNTHLNFFITKIDDSFYKDEYKEYNSENVKNNLMKMIDSY